MKISRLVLASVFALPLTLAAQPPVDSSLAAYIATIKAIDDHAHPLLPLGADSEFDALPLDAIPAFPLPARIRADDIIWRSAWRHLYGAEDSNAVIAAKKRVAQEQGVHAAEWALDQMGTEVMIANRIAPGPGLLPPRFRWVPFDDALLFPLNLGREAGASPDTRSLYPREAKLLRRYLANLHRKRPPATLVAYLRDVVKPTLEAQRRAGAVAIKFEAAYLRSLDFGNPSHQVASTIYARGGIPSRTEYKTLEDFLFREIAREAGRLGMPVQIHCADIAGGFYNVAGGSDPLLLESVFNDSTLRGTNFVILHGGWPNTTHTLSMVGKPNVYADISLMVQILPASTVGAVLRQWLSEYPDKVLFGSDAFAEQNEDPNGWPESGWIGATTARRALGIALTTMVHEGDISMERAHVLARMVLHDNAQALYHL